MLERRNSRLRNLLIVLRRVEPYTDRANHLASTTIGRPPFISMKSRAVTTARRPHLRALRSAS
jgi:hypothetical protein